MLESDPAANGEPTLRTKDAESRSSTATRRAPRTMRGGSSPSRAPVPTLTLGEYGDREIPIPTASDADYATLVQFLYMAPIGLAECETSGEIHRLNPMCAQLLGPLSTGTLIRNLYDVLSTVFPDLRERVQTFQASYGMVCENYQMQVQHAIQGKQNAQVLSLTLLKLDAGHMMAVLSDISASVQRERDLRESQAWVNTMVTGIADYATLLLDSKGIIQSWNPTIARVTGFASHEVCGQPYDMFYPPDAITEHSSNNRLQDADLHGWTLDEGWRTRADGSKFWGSCLVAPLAATDPSNPERHGYSLILRDISERREVNEALRRSVSYDHLTGLANRRAFFEAAESEMERWSRTHSPLSLMVIDADHFKVVNDTYGHHAGDAVLRHLAAGIAAASRTMDFVARFGGEEFVVLLPSTDIEGAHVVGRRLLRSIAAQRVEVDGQFITYTVSAGIATMVTEIGGLEELMKRADAALYVAKANGRNRVERWSDAVPSSGTQQFTIRR